MADLGGPMDLSPSCLRLPWLLALQGPLAHKSHHVVPMLHTVVFIVPDLTPAHTNDANKGTSRWPAVANAHAKLASSCLSWLGAVLRSTRAANDGASRWLPAANVHGLLATSRAHQRRKLRHVALARRRKRPRQIAKLLRDEAAHSPIRHPRKPPQATAKLAGSPLQTPIPSWRTIAR